MPFGVVLRAQMNLNDRRAVQSPSMKPLSPSPSIPPSTSTSQTAAAAPGVVVQQPVPQQAYVPSYRVSLFDALKFNGPGPELINGRLAQWGFVSAALGEAQSGKLIAEQLQEAWPSVLFLSALIIYASLIPICKGAKREPFGIFTPRREIIHCRLAMLGFASLLFLETKSGVVFF
ncbi:hypothetical protein CVIRNUC_002740 [Coccomyxa viridis]|uniref:Uncharacterized protein n=1 Tax=Coccomyxa viridis TaxID=1274662 RepID=A0AAV1HWN1_9CHLO|nr:hypothetical protein CVIRNUC_002740 [Coccomyxa viridis]